MSSCMQALSMTVILASLRTPAGEAAMRPGNSTFLSTGSQHWPNALPQGRWPVSFLSLFPLTVAF
jgi:hypothetical protein